MTFNSNINPELLDEINKLLSNFLQDETIDKLKLSESFMYSYYTKEKYSKPSTIINFQISDGNFLFSVNINKDNNGNIILFNIKKESQIM